MSADPAAVRFDWRAVDWQRAATIALLIVCALSALHEIASPWLWGHNGYNGAAFSQAARNTLRFGELGQAQYWAEPTPPPAETIYTHHPPLLHLHIAALFWIFGEYEWVARLVPAVYSVLGAGMLAWVVRRWWGRTESVVALAVYTFLPINLIYANMIDHEQASIFWLLVMLHNFIGWLDAPRRRYVLGLILSTTMACQFDWPPYYISFYMALMAVALGIRRSERVQWRREYTFVAWFSVVVLANFVGYFGWIYLRMGNLADMIHSFKARSSTPADVWSRQLDHMPDMFQALALWLAVAWTIGVLVRMGRGQTRLRDFVPVAFLAAQVLHQSVFKVAGYLHVYWYYHAAPWVAVGAGLTLLWAARGLGRLVQARQPSRPWLRGLVAAVVSLAVLAPLSAEGFDRMAWGRVHSGSPYMGRQADVDYETGLMGRWIRDITESDEAVAVHWAAGFRVEVLWYMDRTHAMFPHALGDEAVLGYGGYPVAIYVANAISTPPEVLRPLFAAGYHATLLDGHLLLFDFRDRDGELEAWAFEREAPSLAWSFFVNPRHRPGTWEESADQLRWLTELRERVLGTPR